MPKAGLNKTMFYVSLNQIKCWKFLTYIWSLKISPNVWHIGNIFIA